MFVFLMLSSDINVENLTFRPDFFYKLIYGKFFSDLESEDEKKKNKSSENDQLTGHFQSFSFFSELFLSLISPEKQ